MAAVGAARRALLQPAALRRCVQHAGGARIHARIRAGLVPAAPLADAAQLRSRVRAGAAARGEVSRAAAAAERAAPARSRPAVKPARAAVMLAKNGPLRHVGAVETLGRVAAEGCDAWSPAQVADACRALASASAGGGGGGGGGGKASDARSGVVHSALLALARTGARRADQLTAFELASITRALARAGVRPGPDELARLVRRAAALAERGAHGAGMGAAGRGFTPAELAHVTRSLALLGVRGAAAYAPLARAATPAVAELSPAELAHLVTGVATARHAPAPLLRAVASAVLAGACRLDGPSCVQLATALARLDARTFPGNFPALFETLAARASARLADVRPAGLAQLVRAYASAGCAGGEHATVLFRAVARALQSAHGSRELGRSDLGAASGRADRGVPGARSDLGAELGRSDLAAVVWAFAKARAPPSALYDHLAPRVVALAPSMHGGELAQVAHGYAHVGAQRPAGRGDGGGGADGRAAPPPRYRATRAHAAVYAALAGSAVRAEGSLELRSIATLASSFCVAGYYDADLYDAIGRRALPLAPAADTQSLSTLIWASAYAAHAQPALSGALAARVAALDDELGPAHISLLARALAVHAALEATEPESDVGAPPTSDSSLVGVGGSDSAREASARAREAAMRALWRQAAAVEPARWSAADVHRLSQAELSMRLLGEHAAPRAPAPLCEALRAARGARPPASAWPVSSRMQRALSRKLRAAGWEHGEEVAVEAGPLGAGLLTVDMACGASRVALEFDGPYHHLTDPKTHGDRRQTGPTRWKAWALRALGWRVVHVHHADVRALLGNEPGAAGSAPGAGPQLRLEELLAVIRAAAKSAPADGGARRAADGASAPAAGADASRGPAAAAWAEPGRTRRWPEDSGLSVGCAPRPLTPGRLLGAARGAASRAAPRSHDSADDADAEPAATGAAHAARGANTGGAAPTAEGALPQLGGTPRWREPSKPWRSAGERKRFYKDGRLRPAAIRRLQRRAAERAAAAATQQPPQQSEQ